MHKANVIRVPPAFAKFKDANNYKKKKKGLPFLSSGELGGHADAIYSLLLKPVVNTSAAWQVYIDDITDLATCISKYKTHLEEQAKVVAENRKRLAPCRSVGENAVVEARRRCPYPMILTREKYVKIDARVRAAGPDQPVFFDEEIDLEAGSFKNIHPGAAAPGDRRHGDFICES